MLQRKITLIEIGAGALPVVTPVPTRQSSWFPVVYVSPDTPPVEGVVPNPVADGVLIEWAPVDQEGVIYIIERGPTEQGPWTEIHRTTETRYLYSDGSGQQWWFKITASVRGKPGDGTVVEGRPGQVPSYEEMEALNQAIGQEILDRLAGDLQATNDAIEAARSYTNEQVAALNGLLQDITGADEWLPDREYPEGDFVRRSGTLYRALQQNTGVEPGADPLTWQSIGDYTSVGDALAASISMATQNASDIRAEATRLDAVQARMPAGSGGLASAASVSELSQATTDGLSSMGQRVGSVEARMPAGGLAAASWSLVNAVDEASAWRDGALGQRIDSANAALEGKADAGAVQIIQSKVEQLDGRLATQASSLTQVTAKLGGAPNMLKDSSYARGFTYWTIPLGSAIYNEPKYGNYLAVNAIAGGTASEQRVDTTAGIYVLSAEVYRNSDAGNVRVEIGAFSAQGFIGSVTALSDRTKVGQWQQVFIAVNAPAGTTYVNCRIIFEGTNTINSVRRMKLELGLTPTLWTDDTAVQLAASATQSLETRATQLENGQTLLQAQYGWALDVNGRAIGMQSINNGTIGRIDFVADRFGIVDPNNTGSTTFEGGRWVTRSGGYMLCHGKPFGTTGDLMMYIGIGSDPNAASKASGLFWIDNKGNSYFGGSLSAGILRNAVQTGTTQTTGTELVNGPFRTNGGNRSVAISFSRTVARTKGAPGPTGFVAGAGANTATIHVYRRIGTAAEAHWQTLSVTGSVDITNEADGADRAVSLWQGSVTVNDVSSATQDVTYRAVIAGFSEQTVSHTSGSFDGLSTTQNLSIVSVEG